MYGLAANMYIVWCLPCNIAPIAKVLVTFSAIGAFSFAQHILDYHGKAMSTLYGGTFQYLSFSKIPWIKPGFNSHRFRNAGTGPMVYQKITFMLINHKHACAYRTSGTGVSAYNVTIPVTPASPADMFCETFPVAVPDTADRK
jgi:hypothetical protein